MKENLDLNQLLFEKSINPQSLTRLVQELCVEMDEPEFMGYGAGALKEVYRAMRRGMEK